MAASALALTSAPALPSAALAAFWRAHSGAREQRRVELSHAVEHALMVADEVENNCRAALGLQLNAAVANQGALEASAKGLRLHAAGLAKRCAAHASAYDQLAQSVAEAGSLDAHLHATDAALRRIGDHLLFIETRLTAEE